MQLMQVAFSLSPYLDNVKFGAKCHCEERSDEAIPTVACN
jgi:hypothetical protein